MTQEKKLLDWKKIWKDFDKWYSKIEKDNRCEKCGMDIDLDLPNWEDQKSKIEQIIEEMITENLDEKIEDLKKQKNKEE